MKFRCTRVAEFPFSPLAFLARASLGTAAFRRAATFLGTTIEWLRYGATVLRVAIVSAICCVQLAQAQESADLRGMLRQRIAFVADSVCLAYGEPWSGIVWSSVPDFRQTATRQLQNGFILDELELEQTTSSVDPSGRHLAMVQMTLRGRALLSNGRAIAVTDDHTSMLSHDGTRTLEERFPELLKKDSSLWTNTLQPALVALGAIAIVALFFFVRS